MKIYAGYAFVGIGLIAVALLRLLNPVDYPPSDARSQPWFYPLSSSILVAFGLIFVVAGAVGLIRAVRNRPKDE